MESQGASACWLCTHRTSFFTTRPVLYTATRQGSRFPATFPAFPAHVHAALDATSVGSDVYECPADVMKIPVTKPDPFTAVMVAANPEPDTQVSPVEQSESVVQGRAVLSSFGTEHDPPPVADRVIPAAHPSRSAVLRRSTPSPSPAPYAPTPPFSVATKHCASTQSDAVWPCPNVSRWNSRTIPATPPSYVTARWYQRCATSCRLL
mmetsp:Transcript_4393/g.10074  ORF Transcript_4393/g.10074 Transcript_4393/m.10074 type:complete len:207 (-) Transcript_4393:65-685(-)